MKIFGKYMNENSFERTDAGREKWMVSKTKMNK